MFSKNTVTWNYARKATLVYAELPRETDKTSTSRRVEEMNSLQRSHANSAAKSTRAFGELLSTYCIGIRLIYCSV